MLHAFATISFMVTMNSSTTLKMLFPISIAVYIAACLAFYFHAVDLNPQYDTQAIRYGVEMFKAMTDGNLWQWITEPPARKYPMLYVAPFTFAFKVISGEGLTLLQEHYASRAITLLYAFGLLAVVWRIAVKFFGEGRSTIILLFTSLNFFMFATAVRPHIAVAFWTTLTLYASILMREDNAKPRFTYLTFISAMCAFATLQSGLFAFIFPVHAFLEKNSSKIQIAKVGFATLLSITISLCIGYPQMFFAFLGMTSGHIDASMGHDVGFDVLPFLIPQKIWMLFASDAILCLFAILGTHAVRKRHDRYTPIFYYIIAFTIVFGMQGITSIRFFLPLLPMLALLGAEKLRHEKFAQVLLLICIVLAYAKLSYLALQPNTFQQASKYISEKNDYFLSTNIPNYFMNLPYSAYATNLTPIDSVEFLMTATDKDEGIESLPLCTAFIATTTATKAAGTPYMFFWNDMQWPQFYLFFTRSLGQNLRLYCHNPE